MIFAISNPAKQPAALIPITVFLPRLFTTLNTRGRRMRLRKGLIAVTILTLLPDIGRAAAVTYNWIGIVTSSTGSPLDGTAIPVSVTLDASYPADINTHDPTHEATYSGGLGTESGKSPVLAITVAGASVVGWFDSVHIEKNLAGGSLIAIQSALPQCCRSVRFVFSTTMKGVVKSLGIPRTLFPENFQASAFVVTYTATDSYGGLLQ